MTKETNAGSIRNYNLIAGFFHLVQMVVVLVLANDFTLPIVARYMAGPPGSTFAEPITLLDTPIGLVVAIFLGLSAFFHFLVASPAFFPRYSAGLASNRNYFRWVEYSISSSVMIVLIAQICGISDVAAIVSIIDDAKKIEKKIKGAATDSGTEIKYDPETKPGLSNLMTIYSVLSGKTTEELEKEYEGKMYGHLKVDLADVVVLTLRPVREKYDDLMKNKDHLDQLMKSGSERARARSRETLENVYKAVGLVR